MSLIYFGREMSYTSKMVCSRAEKMKTKQQKKYIVARLIRLSIDSQFMKEMFTMGLESASFFQQQNKKLTFLWTSITERESIIISNCCTIRFFIVFNLRFDFFFSSTLLSLLGLLLMTVQFTSWLADSFVSTSRIHLKMDLRFQLFSFLH